VSTEKIGAALEPAGVCDGNAIGGRRQLGCIGGEIAHKNVTSAIVVTRHEAAIGEGGRLIVGVRRGYSSV